VGKEGQKLKKGRTNRILQGEEGWFLKTLLRKSENNCGSKDLVHILYKEGQTGLMSHSHNGMSRANFSVGKGAKRRKNFPQKSGRSHLGEGKLRDGLWQKKKVERTKRGEGFKKGKL